MQNCLFLLLLLSASSLAAQEEPGQPEELSVKIADWSLLDFDDKYQLKKVTIETRANVGIRYANGKVTAIVVIDDEKLLRQFEQALGTTQIPVPRKTAGGFGITPHGLIECETTRGSFKIYWNEIFIFNQEGHAYHRAFRSMGLATVVDRELRTKKFAGIPEDEFDNLSGLRLLKIYRKRFSEQPQAEK